MTNNNRAWTEFLLQSSEDAGHRDWRNVRKNNLQNMAKEPEKPTTTILGLIFRLGFIFGKTG